MQRRRLRAARPHDDCITRRDPVSHVGNGALSSDAYAEVIDRIYNPKARKAITGIEDELHDIRIELKNHGELFERIAVALEKIADR